jgi:hypothetical protein
MSVELQYNLDRWLAYAFLISVFFVALGIDPSEAYIAPSVAMLWGAWMLGSVIGNVVQYGLYEVGAGINRDLVGRSVVRAVIGMTSIFYVIGFTVLAYKGSIAWMLGAVWFAIPPMLATHAYLYFCRHVPVRRK